MNAALSLDPEISEIANPESLNGKPGTNEHPKTFFRQIVARAAAGLESPYDAVASRASLEQLERRCSKSFAPFAKELRERCQ